MWLCQVESKGQHNKLQDKHLKEGEGDFLHSTNFKLSSQIKDISVISLNSKFQLGVARMSSYATGIPRLNTERVTVTTQYAAIMLYDWEHESLFLT